MNHLLTLKQRPFQILNFYNPSFSCIAYIVPEYFTWAIAYTPFFTWYSHVWNGAYY